MDQHHARYLDNSSEVVECLIEIVNVALTEKFPDVRVDQEEAELVLDALRTLRPRCVELRFFDGIIHVVRQNWVDAIDTFRALAAQSVCLPQSRGMLIYCLNMSGSPEWRAEADALQPDDDASLSLMASALAAREDLARAIDAGMQTGVFELPESVAARQARWDAAAAPEADTDPTAWKGYGLRV